MYELTEKTEGGVLTLFLSGQIDSTNAKAAEEDFMTRISNNSPNSLIIDAEKLEYISSAGLRVLLHIMKKWPKLRIVQVRSEVYDVFEMTGFTQMIDIEKAYRQVSVEGAEVIGQGANGTLYRIDSDNVVKIYNDPDALDEIQMEREKAKVALVLGIPTAISYDVVKAGDKYGSVFELLNASSFAKILAEQPERFQWCVEEFADMLKLIHSTLVPRGQLPQIRNTVLKWVHFMKDFLEPEEYQKLLSMVEEVPEDNHMIHGDYHIKNLELQDGEVLLIDMDTLAVGHPVFELASMFNAFIGFGEYDHEVTARFLGIPWENANIFLRQVLERYLETTDTDRLHEVMNKARIIGYIRLIRRSVRRDKHTTLVGRATVDLWMNQLKDLLKQVDTLLF